MKKIVSLFCAVFALVCMTMCAAGVSRVSAFDPFSGVDCSGAAANSRVCTDRSKTSNPLTGKNGIIYKATLLVAKLTGVAAVFIIVLSGFSIVTAAGDSQKIAEARKGITYAVVGLVVVFFAEGIVLFVTSRL